ncbi:MAG: S41 family peptidase [Verrucomicrobiota bacterium]
MSNKKSLPQISTPLFLSALAAAFLMGGSIVYFFLLTTNFTEKEQTPIASQDISEKLTQINTLGDSDKKDQQENRPLNEMEKQQPLLSLTPKDTNILLNLLRTDYIDSASLLSQPLKPENVSSYIQNAPDKIKVTFAPLQIYSADEHNVLELLAHNIAYLRLTSVREQDINDLTSLWPEWHEKAIVGLILDLRFFYEQTDFSLSAKFLSLFVSPNTPLFSVQDSSSTLSEFDSSSQPLNIPAKFPILIVINKDTRGAGELIASYLKKQLNAILLGTETSGEAGLFTSSKKLPSGRYARLAKATAILPDQTDLLGKPIIPDIPLPENEQTTEAWELAIESKVSNTISEITPFPRRNWFEQPDKNSALKKPNSLRDNNLTLRDSFLQKAVSIIRSIHITQQTPPAALSKSE